MKHTLKCHPPMFRAVQAGTKTFEIRKDDRAFQCGDEVELTYYDPANDAPFSPPFPVPPDAKPITKRIGFVLRGGQYGLEPGYVAFSLLEPT